MSAAPRLSRPQTHAIGQVILQNISCKFAEVKVWKISNMVLSRWGIFAAIVKNTLYRSKLSICL